MSVTPFRGRGLKVGQKVKVYRNLNNGRISLMDYKSGLVLAHADSVLLYDVHFQIQKGGQRTAKTTGVRNVHAYAVGVFVCGERGLPSDFSWNEFTYNPFQHDSFVDRLTGFPVVRASKVLMAKGKYFYLI